MRKPIVLTPNGSKNRDTLLVSNTPWEEHQLEGITVFVKRDDMVNPDDTCPPYSKIRGLETYLKNRMFDIPIGVQDAGFHSRQGWGAAYICKHLNIRCYVFYAVLKKEGTLENHELREYHKKARDLGAILVPMKAGRAHILWYQARNELLSLTGGSGEMIPAMFKLKEIVKGSEYEAREYTPKVLFSGTWIFSISSGATAAGVARALRPYHEGIDMICYFGNEHINTDKVRDFMISFMDYTPKSLQFIDEHWEYSQKVEGTDIPFPASPWYEAKTWGWLKKEISKLKQPIVFWNIGT